MNGIAGETFRQQNLAPWWWIWGGLNGLLVLLLGVRALTALWFQHTAAGVVWLIVILLIVNAVTIPIIIVNARKRVVIDIAQGLIATERSGPHAASEFVMIVDHARTFPQPAHLLELRFQRGSVSVEAGAFRVTPEHQRRNEALIAFIDTWITAPERHRSLLGAGAAPGITAYAIGKREAAEILRLP
ncbi:hypothetical protein [Leucobacter musarum]|uniref:hypothetical protein n=1 Tax=Leucobacter musarum TaxID=1930747 RepID=UPI0006A763D8|nr:hypothetical protein [Leucobacter musarum]